MEINKRYGKLVVVGFAGRKGGAYYHVVCDCGCRKVVRLDHLRNGRVVSCGCNKKRKRGIAYNAKAPGYAYSKQLWHRTKRRAINNHLEFDLDLEEHTKIIKNNCAYCNIEPQSHYYLKIKVNGQFPHLGIDRLDSAKGYTKDNVVPCCFVCNRAKGTMPVTEFKKYLFRIADIYKNISNNIIDNKQEE